ncbi:MAG: precorrin-6y C5,15-methyltransferase (decarboxylating) subunit CbiE, partial [Devosia sp.]
MRWLTIVGIGEDGLAGVGEAARHHIAHADIVVGGARHLALAAPLIKGESRAWDSPFIRSIEAVLAERGRAVCVLASGDPFHYGVGATLSRHVVTAEMDVFPHPSAFSLAAGRLGWPLQDVACLSLHGRPLDLIRPHLHPGAHILALTSDEAGPAALAQLLADAGFGGSTITVHEALGGPDEQIRGALASHFTLRA